MKNDKVAATKFLKDGREVIVVTKTTNGYIVDPLIEIEEHTESSGNLIEVIQVFDKAPVHVVEEEYKTFKERVDELKKEHVELLANKNRITSEIRELEKSFSRIREGIIDLNGLRKAKKVTFFENSHALPQTLQKSKHQWKISMSMKVMDQKAQFWVFNLYENDWGGSRCVDPDYGFLLDKTDEEIEEITLERLIKKANSIDNSLIGRLPEKYLVTDELLEIHREYHKKKEKEKNRDIERSLNDLRSKLTDEEIIELIKSTDNG